jgi:hypothetical protein
VQIEQAIFTSAKTDRAQGYQLLSRSPQLDDADARELSLWAPSHGSLLDEPRQDTSANFFQLASGAYCVSRTTRAGAEYSGRGEVIYTQFLVVPPEVLARFANNPFAILRAAAASGGLCVLEDVPESLPPLTLCGRAPLVDSSLVAQIARDPGPAVLATLVQAALGGEPLAICYPGSCEALVAGLFNVLPVECRTEFSFTTGLKHSPRRPVRLSAITSDESACRAAARQGIVVVRLDGQATLQGPWHGWAQWVHTTLTSGKLSALSAELEQARPGLTCANLDAVAEQLLESEPVPRRPATPEPAVTRKPLPKPGVISQRTDQSHAPHAARVAVETDSRSADLDTLAERLAQQPADILEMLERIDDLVFAAISGDAHALAELEVLWPLTVSELDAELAEQSREQYLRCVLAICNEPGEGGASRPEKALAAVDVLCVLFEE